MSAAALQKMMETAVMPLRMTSFLLEYQSTLGCVSFFPCVQSKTITWLGFRSKTVLQWPEDIKKTGRGVYPGPEVSRSKKTVDVSTSQPWAKPNLATCQRNVLEETAVQPQAAFLSSHQSSLAWDSNYTKPASPGTRICGREV